MADQNILIKFSADTQDAVSDVNKLNQSLEGTEQATNDVNKATQSLRAQLRGMQQALAEMAKAGKANTDEYRALRNEAGQLADVISDAKREIATAGSDTRGLDKAIRATSVLVGGFTALQGAVALFGKEGENLQKTLVKVNGAMAILQGLQAVQNELTQKDSILTAAATKAKALYAIAVGNGTKALKLFRLALAATGLGAIALVIGTVVTNWDRLSKAITDSFPALSKVGDFFRDFQFYMVGTAKSAVAFFRGLGDAFSAFFNGEFKQAAQEIRNIPEEMRTAFDNGFAEAKKAARESEDVEEAGKIVGERMGNAAGKAFVESLNARIARMRQESNRGRTIQGQGGIGSMFFGGAFEDVTITPGAERQGRGTTDTTRDLDERISKEKEYIDYLLQGIQFVADLTGMIADARSARIEEEIADLEKLREEELKNARLTAEQKERIEERYQKRIARLKTEEAKAQRRADIIQAIINTALAVSRATTLAQRIIAAAVGAAQIAIISRQPLPKFRHGGEVKGALHQSGGVPIEAEGGEYIMKREAVSKYGKDVMKKINDLALPKSLLMPDLPAAVIAGAVHGIDHDKLGKTIGRELAKQPKVSIALDERGFNKFVQEGNRTRNYANRKFNAG